MVHEERWKFYNDSEQFMLIEHLIWGIGKVIREYRNR